LTGKSHSETTPPAQAQSSALGRELALTTFPDLTGKRPMPQWVSLAEFSTVIAVTTAPARERLPLVSLARFGGRRSSKGSKRFDKNIREIFGAILDVDGGLTIEEVAERFHNAGVPAVIHSTPSGRPDRCRVLLPFSTPQPPDRHATMVGRAASLLDGATVDGASWNASQAYFYGVPAGRPAPTVIQADGQGFVPVDLRDDLPVVARPTAPRAKAARKTNGQDRGNGADPDPTETSNRDFRTRIVAGGQGTHDAMVSWAGQLAAEGCDAAEITAVLIEALSERPFPARSADWRGHLADVPRVAVWAAGKEDHSEDWPQAPKAAVQPQADPWAAELPPLPALPPQPAWPEPMGEPAYYGITGELVRLIDPTTEADPNVVLLQHLVFFGNAIGIGANTPTVMAGSTVQRTSEFLLVVGPTAKGRKGTARDDVSAIYSSVDPAWFDNHVFTGCSSGEGVIGLVRDPVMGLDDDGQVVVKDPGSDTKHVLIVEGEFAGTLAVLERVGNTLATQLRNAWDGKPLGTITRHGRLRATDYLISISADTTPIELRLRLPVADAANGFANRFLIALSTASKDLPRPPQLDMAGFSRITAHLSRAVQQARVRGAVTLTEAAWSAWATQHRPELTKERSGLLGEVLSRAQPHCLRLALLYALLDLKAEINAVHLDAAMAVWRYCAASADYLFGDRQTDPLRERLLAELRYEPDGLTRRQLHKVMSNHVSAGALSAALAELLRDGLVRREVRATASRPAETWLYVPGRRA
jgi:hypothetical protein